MRGGDEILTESEVARRPKVALTFAGPDRTVQACVGESILGAALRHGVEIGHQCGGWCACTACHVIVLEGEENLSVPEEDEEDRLDEARGQTLRSRLACQALLLGGPVTVRIPSS